ncbi:MAG: hypothetical protein A2Z66_08955 [Chloroflexi bacterium RBG_13_66_10]|nr:MAG: hypothetical protein A2Z66_08955 [Chloroflexi bacterium RBG_13_66_10]
MSRASETLRLRLIWSQTHRPMYRPAHRPWRSSTGGGEGATANRRWSTHTNGSAVPVTAAVSSMKKSQRGPTVGSVVEMMRSTPGHPMAARTRAATIRLR